MSEKQVRSAALREQRYRRAYTRCRQWEKQEDALRDLVPVALKALAEALDDKTDPKLRVTAALAVLRATGLNGLRRPAEPDRLLMQFEDVEPDLEDAATGTG